MSKSVGCCANLIGFGVAVVAGVVVVAIDDDDGCVDFLCLGVVFVVYVVVVVFC